jgi:hypothetical protein
MQPTFRRRTTSAPSASFSCSAVPANPARSLPSLLMTTPRRRGLSHLRAGLCEMAPACVVSFLLLVASVRADVLGDPTGEFGMSTIGGLKGRVIRVTSLGRDGPGTLRAAVEAKGPRLVVFEVGGIIDLARKNIRVREPYLTIAGQTAPNPGITLLRGALAVETHDVVIQHLSVRPGDAGQPRKSGWSPDGIAVNAAFNVLIDHCSATWAVDENLSVSGPRYQGPGATSHDVTIRHCLIAQGLDNSSHEKGPHSKGSLIHDCCRNIAIIANLYAHNADRNPYFKAETSGVIVNNLIHNPGRAIIHVSFAKSEWQGRPMPAEGRVSVIGNVLISGVNTRSSLPMISGTGEVHEQDNVAQGRDDKPILMLDARIRRLPEKPVWPPELRVLPSNDVVDYVVRTVGSRPWQRDPIDQRIVDSVLKRDGRIIDSQDEVGGYPIRESTRRELGVVPDGPEARCQWLDRMEGDRS